MPNPEITPDAAARVPYARLTPADFAVLLLRATVALPIYYYQIQDQKRLAWGFLWEKQDWPLVQAMAEEGLPQPEALAVGLVFLLLACPFALLAGFLARASAALIFLALAFFFLTGLPLSIWLTAQTYLLFLGVAAALVISGPGRFSLDAQYSRMRHRRRTLRAEAEAE